MPPSARKKATKRAAASTPSPTGQALRSQPLVATKFRPPSNRGSLIERPQLLARLQPLLRRKLALIHGPAGFGKTTLASQWHALLRSEQRSVAWLSMDASDNDINRFLSYLTEAIHLTEPEIGNGLLEVIEANPGSAADFVLDTLANDLTLFGNDFVLFLDDWHLIVEPQVHETLQLLLSRGPANLHVVVASRTRAGLPLSRLRVGDELIEIDAAALRFDLDESTSYLRVARALDLPSEDIAALWRSTEGWAAALQLAGLSLRGCGDRDRILQWTSGSASDIGEYLAENVLGTLPEAQLRFMLETSILERLSSGLCAAVSGDPDSADRLDELERQELFLLPLDDERLWFRYHHLFAQFLQRRLKRQMPDRIRDLHVKASDWFGEHGYVAESVEHALAAGETAAALERVEAVARNLVENSFMSSLLNLVRKLPRTAMFDRPELQMAIAWANCLSHRPQEAEEALWHVERVASDQPTRRQRLLRDEARVLRACVLVYGDRTEGEQIEALARPCLDRASDFRPWVVGVAANVVAYQHLHQHRLGSVSPILHWAREYQDRAEGLFAAVYGRCFEGLAAYRAGDYADAKHWFVEAIDLAARTAGKQSNAARLASALLGQVLYEENQLEEAERLLRESRFLGFEGGVVDFYLATYLSMGRLAMLKGNPQEALDTLQEGEDTAAALKLERLGVAMACARARVKLEIGDVRGAEQVLSAVDALRHRPSSAVVPENGEVHAHIEMAKARLWCVRGAPARAVDSLTRLVQLAADSGWRRQELAARVLLALALDAAGDPVGAETTLLAAVEEGLPRGMPRLFLDEGTALVGILERARDRARRSAGGEPGAPTFSAHAQRLLTASRHPAHGLPRYAGARSRVADLTARESEVLQLLDQGLANKEIARKLEISVDTVKWFLKNVFSKLGVSTRTQAIAEARRLGIFDAFG